MWWVRRAYLEGFEAEELITYDGPVPQQDGGSVSRNLSDAPIGFAAGLGWKEFNVGPDGIESVDRPRA